MHKQQYLWMHTSIKQKPWKIVISENKYILYGNSINFVYFQESEGDVKETGMYLLSSDDFQKSRGRPVVVVILW